MTSDTELAIRPANPADRPTLERLWLMFRHDLSEFGGQPGPWAVAFQGDNVGAVRFWRCVAEALAPGRWTEERRSVPQRADLAPDVWVSFGYPG